MKRKYEFNWIKTLQDGRSVHSSHSEFLDTPCNLDHLSIFLNITEFKVILKGDYSLYKLISVTPGSTEQDFMGLKIEVNLPVTKDKLYSKRVGNCLIVTDNIKEENNIFEEVLSIPLKGKKKVNLFLYPSGKLSWKVK
jgi:hypothetical protein